MIKRRKYPDSLNVGDYFEVNMTDVWAGINELQRATKVAALIALVAVLIDPRSLRKLCMKIFYKFKKTVLGFFK
ncbi:hypothetical protein AALB39_26915 [Lachnospiraceae bacterium 54-53]